MAETTAVVLVGGKGHRLRSVVSDRPKVLAEVCGRPFLAYLLNQLIAAGIRQAVLCTGYLGEQVRQTFGDCYGNLRLMYSQEHSPLGTGGALRHAIAAVDSDPVLVMNGDSWCETSLSAARTCHENHRAEGTLVLARAPDTGRFGRVDCDQQGRITAFTEKGGAAGPGWINAGIYFLGRQLLLSIPPEASVSLEHEVFPAWIGRGLYGCPSQGRFLDIGTPEAYAAAESFFSHSEGRVP